MGTLDDGVVGLAVASLDADPLDGGRPVRLELLYVVPGARRHGVGSALFDDVRRWSLEHGCGRVDVPSLPGDRAVKSFFEAKGLRARLLLLSSPLEPPA